MILQFVKDFLKAYTIPPDVKLQDDIWKQFFCKVVDRFPAARLHSFLLDFLKALSQKYVRSHRAVNFILDLLSLGVSKLLSGK